MDAVVTFSELCAALERVRLATHRELRRVRFVEFLNDIAAKPIESTSDGRSPDFYPVMRLVVPTLDKGRRFQLRQKRLAERVAKVLAMTAADLLVYEHVPLSKACERLAAAVDESVPTKPTNMSVKAVNRLLDSISVADGADNSSFERLALETTKLERLYAFCIMTGNVENYVGIATHQFLDWFAPGTSLRQQLGANLRELTENRIVVEGDEDIEETAKQKILGRPFMPQLLHRPAPNAWYQVIAESCGVPCYAETKFDGEHMLLHRLNDGDEYRWFSRRGVDFSNELGTSRDEGLSARIHPFFKEDVHDAVLDCELLLWDRRTGTYVRHDRSSADGQRHGFRKEIDPQAGIQQALMVFDVLWLNGRSLLDSPLAERLLILERQILQDRQSDTIQISRKEIINSREELEAFYRRALLNGEEGVVVKKIDAKYAIGSRAKANGWFKLKPNLARAAVLDLAAVGIEPHGNPHGGVAFVFAAITETGRLRIVARVWSGMVAPDRSRLTQLVGGEEGITDEAPDWLDGVSPKMRKSTRWAKRMVDCPVVEVSCTAVTDGHLVFPAMRRLRPDKLADDVDGWQTVQTFEQRMADFALPLSTEATTGARLTKRRVMEERILRDAKRPKIDAAVPQLFAGRKICILAGKDDGRRTRLAALAVAMGAEKVVANPGPETELIVVTTKEHPKTKAQIKAGRVTIVDGEWLIRCEHARQAVTWKEEELLCKPDSGLDSRDLGLEAGENDTEDVKPEDEEGNQEDEEGNQEEVEGQGANTDLFLGFVFHLHASLRANHDDGTRERIARKIVELGGRISKVDDIREDDEATHCVVAEKLSETEVKALLAAYADRIFSAHGTGEGWQFVDGDWLEQAEKNEDRYALSVDIRRRLFEDG